MCVHTVSQRQSWCCATNIKGWWFCWFLVSEVKEIRRKFFKGIKVSTFLFYYLCLVFFTICLPPKGGNLWSQNSLLCFWVFYSSFSFICLDVLSIYCFLCLSCNFLLLRGLSSILPLWCSYYSNIYGRSCLIVFFQNIGVFLLVIVNIPFVIKASGRAVIISGLIKADFGMLIIMSIIRNLSQEARSSSLLNVDIMMFMSYLHHRQMEKWLDLVKKPGNSFT